MKIQKKFSKEVSSETNQQIEIFKNREGNLVSYKDKLGQIIPIDAPTPSKTFIILTDQATIAWDYSDGYNAQVTLGGNRTLAEPTNVENGDYGTLEIIQDATGSRTLTLPLNFKVVNSGTGAVTLTTTPGFIDILTWVYDGTSFNVVMGLSYTAWNTYSATFDGATGTYVNLTNNANLQPAGAFTLSGWVYIDDIAGNHVVIANNTAAGGMGYVFWVRATPNNQITFSVNTTTAWTACVGTTNLAAGQWYHVAATYAGASSDIKVYVNGILETTVTSTANPINYTGTIGSIGKYNISYAHAKMDEIALFSTALTAGTISSIYGLGKPSDLTLLTPVAWYRMGDADASPTIINHGTVGAVINGTLTNLPVGTSGFIINTP